MSLEGLFDRYRRKGDARALAAVFDRAAPKLLRVARHLARDEAEAEDLVQATFVEAIDHADRFDAGRALVPWLVGILNNKARQARDGESRMASSADVARPARVDPVEAAEVAEFSAALERALRRVPEAYRDVVRIHIGEGRAPEDIARQLGLRPGTVRVQLHRGLKHLRRLLPAGFGLGGEVVKPPARGLGEVRAAVLAHAPVAPAVSAAAFLGGVLMTKKIVTLAAALALLAVPAWFWIDREPPSPPGATRETAAVVDRPSSAEEQPESDGTVALDAQAGERRAVEVAESVGEPYGSLELELVWWDGDPAAGVGVQLIPFGERQPYQRALRAVADQHGRLGAPRIREGKVVVGVDGRSGHPVKVERGVANRARIEIPRGVDVAGRVVDESGRPVAGASLWVGDWRTPLVAAWKLGGSDEDGRFFLRSLETRSHVFSTAARLGSSENAALREEAPDSDGAVRLELVVRGASAALEGTIFDAGGEPLTGAVVSVQCNNTLDGGTVLHWPFARVLTDEQGRYRVDGLHAGWARAWVESGSHALAQENVELLEGRVNRLDVRLGRGFAVEGRLVSARPLPERTSVELERDYLERQLQPLLALVDPDGRYRLENLPPGQVTLTASLRRDGERQEVSARIAGGEGDVVQHDILLDHAPTLLGRAVDELGRGLAGWSVLAVPASMQTTPGSVTTDDDGRFAIAGVLGEHHDLWLYAPDGNRNFPRASVESVLPDGPEIELVAVSSDVPSAHLTGRVIGPSGEVVRPQSIWARRLGNRGSVGNPDYDADGSFRIGPMPPGTYELSISPEDLPHVNLPDIAVEPEQLVELGDIRLQEPGDVELVVRRSDGELLDRPSGVLLSELGYGTVLETEDGLTFRTQPMNPGTYTLALTAGNAASVPHQVVVRPSETTRAELTLPPGHRVWLWVVVPAGDRLPKRVRVVVRDSAGDVVFEREGIRTDHDGMSLMAVRSGFVAGTHTYTAEAPGWHGAGSFDVGRGVDRFDIDLARDP